MNAAFAIDGICLDESDKKILLSVAPTLVGPIANNLITCLPRPVLELQEELDDLDAKIAGLHIDRAALKERIRLAWDSATRNDDGEDGGDKRWKAVRACGHQLRNTISILFAEKVEDAEAAAERCGLEIFEADESDGNN